MHSLVIKNGTIVDGTGRPPYVGDIAIDGDRIAQVGGTCAEGRRTIDARGRLVTPGFIDVHTHYDGQVMWDEVLAPTIWHGVTTAIIGNCGVGFAPARAADRSYLIDMMATVEGIPAESLAAGLPWDWEDYPQYLDAVAARRHRINIGSMITHAPLRIYVMGARSHDVPTVDDLARMCALVREGMRAGAVGLSTSRTMLHTTSDGVTIPGTDAGEDELVALALAVREGAGRRGVLEISPAGITCPEPKALLDEVDLMIRVAHASACPVVFSLAQMSQSPRDYRLALDRVEAARAEGVPIHAEICTRPVGILVGFQDVTHPFATAPSFVPLLDLPFERRIAALREPATRARIVSEQTAPTGISLVFAGDGFWKDVFVMGDGMNYYPRPEDSIQNIAERTGRTPREVAYDAMLEKEGRAFLIYAIVNWADRNRGPLREMFASPGSVVGLADGGAHVTAISDSSQPTTLLADWVRGRGPDDPDRIPIELAISKLTRTNAELFGLADRGALMPGLKADINVIDLEGLGVLDPEMVYDLPLDRPRLDQRSTGYVATIVNGAVVQESGRLTDASPGALLRANAAAIR